MLGDVEQTITRSGLVERPAEDLRGLPGERQDLVAAVLGPAPDPSSPGQLVAPLRESDLLGLFPFHDQPVFTRTPGEGRSSSTSRRKRNSFAGRPPVLVRTTPVGSTSPAVSTSRRKFCL